jgi:hypothetical protein
VTLSVALPSRLRIPGAVVYVHPAGSDVPGNGLSNGSGAFVTPAYALAWCAANLDPAGTAPTIVVDASGTYTVNPFGSSEQPGIIWLQDLMGGVPGSWTEGVPTITGGVGGVPIPLASWGASNPGPLIAADGVGAVVAVGRSTVWAVQCMQLESTVADVIADRGSRINAQNIAHGAFAAPYASPAKYTAEYGGSIEVFSGIIVNAGGVNLWQSNFGALIIGVGTAPTLASGVSFSGGYTEMDATSCVVLPSGWPK